MKVLQFLKVNVGALLLMLSLAVISTGCNDDDPAAVSVSKEIILVGSDAQAVPVTIMSNTNWTAESNSPWVRLSQASGRGTTDIELLIEACTAVNDRSATVTVKAGGKSTIIDVTQNATAGLLVIAPEEMQVGNTGGIVSFVIASNSPWTISSSNTWAVPSVTAGNGNATVSVTVASNESHFDARKATLAVTTGQGAKAIVRTFTVDQLSRALPHVTVAQQAVSFAHNAKSARTNVVLIPIVSNVTGNITAHTEFNWNTAEIVTLQGVKYVRIQCESDNMDNNNRDCIVNVLAHVDGEATIAQIRVTQAGVGSPDIVMFRDNVALDCNAATAVPVGYYFPNGKSISVKAVSEESRWITNVKVDASKKRITFDVTKNIAAETRVGTIMVTATLGTETLLYPITVSQDGVGEANVSVLPESLSFGALTNLTATASVTSQTSYTTISAVAADASWLTVELGNETSNNGSYAQEVKLTATPNALSSSRTATVSLTISYGDKLVLRTISVSQAGLGSPYLVIMPQEVTVSRYSHNSEGRDIVITYLAPENVSIEAVSTTDWLNVYSVFTHNNKIVVRIPDANRDEADRTGIVNVSVTRDGETVIYPVKVTQRGLGAIDVRIAPEVITLDATADVAQFVVSAQYAGAQVRATVTSGAEWLNEIRLSSDRSNNYVTRVYHIGATPNVDAAPRMGTITVTTEWGNKTDVRTVTVIQNGLGAPAVSTVANAYMLSDQTTHTQSLWIEDGNKNNVSYQVSSISYQSGTNNNMETQTAWITNARVDNHNLVITAQKNTFDEQRDGEITIIASRGTEKAVLTVHVTQAGHKTPGMTGLPSLLTRDFNPANNLPLQFNMLNNSTIKQVYSSHPEWLTVTITSNNSILYGVTRYPGGERSDYREGVITIVVENGSSNTAVYTVTVHQMSPEMPGILGLPTEIVRDFNLVNNVPLRDYQMQNNASIISVRSSTNGVGINDGWLKVYMDGANNVTYSLERYQGGETGGSRVGYIYITVDNAHANEVTYVVPVRQLAPEMPGIAEQPKVIGVGASGVTNHTLVLNAINGATLTLERYPSWMTTTPTISGTPGGQYTLTYTVPAWNGDTQRSGDFVIKATNNNINAADFYIPVTQYGSTYAYVEGSASFVWDIDDFVTSFNNRTSLSRTHSFNLVNVPSEASITCGSTSGYLESSDSHGVYASCVSRLTPSVSKNGTSIDFTVTYSHTYGYTSDGPFRPTGVITVPVTISTAYYTQTITLAVSIVNNLP